MGAGVAGALGKVVREVKRHGECGTDYEPGGAGTDTGLIDAGKAAGRHVQPA
jgi:hypothetical protein